MPVSHRTAFTSLPNAAKTVALPSEFQPVRYPTFPAIERTGVLDYKKTETVKMSSIGHRFVLTRDPGVPYLLDRSPPTTYFRTNVYSATTDYDPGATYLLSESFTGASTLTPNGPSLHNCGYFFIEHLARFWIPILSPASGGLRAFSTIFSSSAPAARLPACDYVIEFEVLTETGQITVTTQTGAIPAGQSFYEEASNGGPSGLAFRLKSLSISNVDAGSVAGTNLSLLIKIAHTGEFLATSGVNPEFDNSKVPFESTRINASSLLLTNVTKVINKEGTVLASRMLMSPMEGSWPWTIQSDSLNRTHPSERYFGALEKGSYTFTAPDSESLEFHQSYKPIRLFDLGDNGNTVRWVEGNGYLGVLNSRKSYFNAIYCSDDDISTPTSLAVTLDIHYEFRTVSTLFTLSTSAMPIEDYHKVQLILNEIGFFYENDSHWGTVVKRVLSAVNQGINFLAPALPPPVQAAIKAVNALTNRPAPATKPPARAPPRDTRRARQRRRNQTQGNMRQKAIGA